MAGDTRPPYNLAAYRKSIAVKYALDHEHTLDAGPKDYRYCSACYENAKLVKKAHSARGGKMGFGPNSKGPGRLQSRQKKIHYHQKALDQLLKNNQDRK